jgi:hypothetical protein
MRRSAIQGVRGWAPALFAAACLWSAPPARAQFFPFWGQQPAARPLPGPRPQPAPQSLSAGQVRAVLAREGVRLVGTPRRRGGDIVAIGRDEDGDRKRFTLDAMTGEVLDITVLERPEDRPPVQDLSPPDAALPPPDHAPSETVWPQPDPDARPDPGVRPEAAAPRPDRAPPAPKAVSVAPLAPAGPAAAPKSEASRSNPADSALSPIKPLHPPPGAPKVEPLPQ